MFDASATTAPAAIPHGPRHPRTMRAREADDRSPAGLQQTGRDLPAHERTRVADEPARITVAVDVVDEAERGGRAVRHRAS